MRNRKVALTGVNPTQPADGARVGVVPELGRRKECDERGDPGALLDAGFGRPAAVGPLATAEPFQAPRTRPVSSPVA